MIHIKNFVKEHYISLCICLFLCLFTLWLDNRFSIEGEIKNRAKRAEKYQKENVVAVARESLVAGHIYVSVWMGWRGMDSSWIDGEKFLKKVPSRKIIPILDSWFTSLDVKYNTVMEDQNRPD